MKLLITPPSPFARKARIVILEKGLQDICEIVPVDLNQDFEHIRAVNPLGKIPALIRDDASPLVDSKVICEFLDSLNPKSNVLPPVGPARWDVLQNQAIADGLADAGVVMLVHKRLIGGDLPEIAIARHMDAMVRSLDNMEAQVESFGTAFDLGQISYVSALDWIDFRYPDIAWKTGRPNLSAWYASIQERPSIKATAIPR